MNLGFVKHNQMFSRSKLAVILIQFNLFYQDFMILSLKCISKSNVHSVL